MALHTNYLFKRWTSQGLLGVRWTPDFTLVICNVKLHITDLASASESASVSSTGSFDGATTDFTIQVDSGFGAAYDVVLLTQDMSSATDYVWLPEQFVAIQRPDELLFSLATPEIWGLEVVYRREL